MAANDPQPSGLRANNVALPSAEDASSQALSEALSSSFVLVRLLIAALCVGFLFSCIFQVKQNEVAIILRFGSPVGSTAAEQVLHAGLHWALPYPIDEIVKIPVGESRSVRSTTGWYLQSDADAAAGQKPDELPSLTPGRDSYVLTGDGNILHVRATVFYRLSNPVAFTFNFDNPTTFW